MCQGKVANTMKDKIKQMKSEMFEAIKEKVVEAEQPNEEDVNGILVKLDKITL